MPYTFNPFTGLLDFYDASSGGTVTSVSGTANRITVTNPTTTPVIDIAATYVGQTSITTLGTIVTGVWNGTAVDATHGGTAQTTWATGDLLYASGVNTLAKLAAGSNTQVLTLAAGVPSWAAPATAGTVTSVSGTANQVAVATGTTTPVISLVGPYTPATYTAHGVLIGEGTSSIVALAAGTAGQILQSGGASADPAYSTSTYPATNAINTLLYASSANIMAALATANSGVLTTSTSGVPSIDTTNFHVLSTGVQMKGNNTNTAPPAGFIGERISNSASGISLSNNTTTNVTSISLTAGVWDIDGSVFILNFGVGSTQSAQITSTSATLSGNAGIDYNFYSIATTGLGITLIPPKVRAVLSATTTYYIVANSNFSTSTSTANGAITATRVG